MTRGHLGQYSKIHCEIRLRKLLSSYISTSGIFFDVQCIFIFQTHALNSIRAGSFSCSILGILVPFACSVFPFCHPLGNGIAYTKQEFPKR